MNFGKQGIIQKKKRLNSSGSRLGTKLGVTVVKLLFIAVIAVIVAGSCLALGAAEGIIASAPDVSTIDVSPEGYATKIYDDGGNEIQTLSTSGSNRIYVDVEDIPITLQHAFIAIEDERFYDHNGIDLQGILRAGVRGITHGFHFSEGASTITQQLLKLFSLLHRRKQQQNNTRTEQPQRRHPPRIHSLYGAQILTARA